MLRQTETAKSWGAHGLVFGILAPDSSIDMPRLRRLVQTAAPLPVTFHRAFDTCPDLHDAAASLVELGVARVLTSGGRSSAEEGLETLRKLNQEFKGRIGILPGGGVRPGIVRRIVETVGASEVHSAARNERGTFEGNLVEEMLKEIGARPQPRDGLKDKRGTN